MLREIPNVLAINLIGNPSARCNRRISAQSATDNNSLHLSAVSRDSDEGGSEITGRHGVSFQATPTERGDSSNKSPAACGEFPRGVLRVVAQSMRAYRELPTVMVSSGALSNLRNTGGVRCRVT